MAIGRRYRPADRVCKSQTFMRRGRRREGMTRDGGPRTIDSVERACRVVDVLEERGTVGVSELAEAIGLSKGSAYSYLATLVENGYAVADDGRYRLSFRHLSLSRAAIDRIGPYDVVTEQLDAVADEHGERAQFAVEEGGRTVYLYRAAGEEAVNPSVDIGRYEYLHCIALGKTMLARLPDDRVDEVVDRHGLPARTSSTVTDRGELDAELERIRDRGYAVDDGERVHGIRCIAVPLNTGDSDPLGAISISGPERRMTDERMQDELLESLLRAANVIEVNTQLG